MAGPLIQTCRPLGEEVKHHVYRRIIACYPLRDVIARRADFAYAAPQNPDSGVGVDPEGRSPG